MSADQKGHFSVFTKAESSSCPSTSFHSKKANFHHLHRELLAGSANKPISARSGRRTPPHLGFKPRLSFLPPPQEETFEIVFPASSHISRNDQTYRCLSMAPIKNPYPRTTLRAASVDVKRQRRNTISSCSLSTWPYPFRPNCNPIVPISAILAGIQCPKPKEQRMPCP